ncbi:MAG: hypothetical protein LIP28_05360, partial [Deltaproteobacteria bacterium]|nr:hypothetical protein [Deltaproteobacteria bacterium]
AEERGMPFLLPSVFFADKDECPARDGSLPGFLCVGSVDGSRRDYDQLIDAGILLTERGFSGRYRVSVACSSSETDYYRTFRDNLSRYSLEGDVVVYENLPFRDLFALARETPYQLFLLNKRSRWNLKYLAEKITGGINISFGFGIVPVLEDVFARRWGVEDLSLVYDGTEGLVGAIEAVVENPSLFIPNRDRIFAANERLVAESETSLASVL